MGDIKCKNFPDEFVKLKFNWVPSSWLKGFNIGNCETIYASCYYQFTDYFLAMAILWRMCGVK